MSIEIFTAEHRQSKRWEFTLSEDSAATITVIGRKRAWYDKDTQDRLVPTSPITKLLNQKWDFARTWEEVFPGQLPDLTGTWASPA